MAQTLQPVLIGVTDVKRRGFFLAVNKIISFASTPGSTNYTVQMSDGSKISVSKEQCDRIINSKWFKVEASGSKRGIGW